MHPPLASVIIPTYNRAASLPRVLGSLAAMSVPPELQWEVVVVDNNSNDNTQDVVTAFATLPHLHLRYVHEHSQGASRARNAGILAARGHILAFIDDDVIVDSHWLAELALTFTSHAADCVGGKILLLWPRPRPKWLTREIDGYLGHLDYGDDLLELKKERPILYSGNMAVTRKIIARVGPFDPQLGRCGRKLLSHEEKDLFQRIIRAGGKAIYQPRAIVQHALRPECLERSHFRRLHFYDGVLQGFQLGDYHHRNILGVPYYVVRDLLVRLCDYIRIIPRSTFRSSFRRQLYICYCLGFIIARVRRHLNPDFRP